MDDFLIMSRKRWHLRHCIAALNKFFDAHGFEKHPDKTQTGRLSKGFDWLGVYFATSQKPTISRRSMKNHHNQRLQVYERARRWGDERIAGQRDTAKMRRALAKLGHQ